MTTPNWDDAVKAAQQAEKEAAIEKFILDNAEKYSHSPSTPAEQEALRDYIREGGKDRWKQKAKLDVQNRRTKQQLDNSDTVDNSPSAQARANGLTEVDGDYFDQWGRECRPDGTRY